MNPNHSLFNKGVPSLPQNVTYIMFNNSKFKIRLKTFFSKELTCSCNFLLIRVLNMGYSEQKCNSEERKKIACIQVVSAYHSYSVHEDQVHA